MKVRAIIFVFSVWAIFFGFLLYQTYQQWAELEPQISLHPLETVINNN